MRILVFSDIPPYVRGGAEMQALRLCEQWLARGHSVEVAGHRTPNISIKVGKHELPIYNLPVMRSWGRGVRALSFFLSMSLFLCRHRKHYDLIYCRFLGEAALSVCVLKALGLLHLPLIAVPASASAQGDIALLHSLPLCTKIIRLINRHCNAVNLIAPALENDLCQAGIKVQHYSYIPNGVPLQSYSQRRVLLSPRKLLFVGRLEAQKGLDILLKALVVARAKGALFQLQIIGVGRERQKLESLCIQNGLEDIVLFQGAMESRQVWQAMMRTDVFILPSRFEGLSNAALEALASGLPIIVTACGGIDTYITPDIGWVCPIEDTAALAKTILEACSVEPEILLQMGKKAHDLVQHKFSIERTAEQHLALFARLAFK